MVAFTYIDHSTFYKLNTWFSYSNVKCEYEKPVFQTTEEELPITFDFANERDYPFFLMAWCY